MVLADYEFMPLKEDTDIKPFDCGDNDLNGFLFDDAKEYLKDLFATTYLLVDSKNNRTVAYFVYLMTKLFLILKRRIFGID